jgi:two-component system LytT family response regulator
MPHRALLVDDERLARKRLRRLLAGFPEIQIVAEAATVPAALAATREQRPDVVFLDIQLPGLSGFDFLERAEGSFATVFVTAHDRFALRAFEVNGLDYLLKPVESERLARAVHRLSSRQAPAPSGTPLQASDYVFVAGAAGARFLQVRRIQCILAAGPYSEICMQDGSRWMMLRSMTEWQDRLPPSQFARIHRSSLVNLDFVEQIQPLASGSYRVLLKDSKRQLLLSRRRALLLRERLR